MPYAIKWEEFGVYTIFWGEVSSAQIEDASLEIRSNPRVSGIKFSISDFLATDQFKVSRFQALLIAAHDHEAVAENPALKVAIVVTQGVIADLAEAYATSPLMKENAKVFHSLEAAREWVTQST